jgi:hypothetical protein
MKTIVFCAFAFMAIHGALEAADIAPPPRLAIPDTATQSKMESARGSATASLQDSVLREKLLADYSSWQSNWKGSDLHPSLSYIDGKPILMLVVSSSEANSGKYARMKAIVAACGFLLADDAFEQAVISIISYDPLKPAKQPSRNTTVKRATFQAAVNQAGKKETFQKSLEASQEDEDFSRKICADLGIQ